MTEAIELLAELVERASVNPRLAGGAAPLAGEARVTEWLARFAAAQGWPWARQAVHPERDNFLTLVAGGGGQTLLWDAHQDTVSIDGMTVEPLAATIRDGRVYGRGACDVKGSLAAMLAALVAVSRQPAEERPSILLSATVNEECGFTGARELARLWQESRDGEAPVCLDESGGLTLAEVRLRRPAAAIVAEPTEFNVVVAHRGVVRWKCAIIGAAAHSSRPELGVNAIYGAAEVVRAIEEFHRDVLAVRPADALCGVATACVTTIRGGTGPNTVPDRVVIDIDRRLPPGVDPHGSHRELIEFVAARVGTCRGCRIEHEQPWLQSWGLANAMNQAWGGAVVEVARLINGESRVLGAPYGTNGASIAAAGIPTVVCGPGSIAQAHTADEWIAVDALDEAVDFFSRIAQGEAVPAT